MPAEQIWAPGVLDSCSCGHVRGVHKREDKTGCLNCPCPAFNLVHVATPRHWMAVDCEICGASSGELCRPILPPCDCGTCKRIDALTRAGEMYCGGGRRALHQMENEE